MKTYPWITGNERGIYDVRNSFLNYVRKEKKRLGKFFDPDLFFDTWREEIIEMWDSLHLREVKKVIKTKTCSGKHGSKWEGRNYEKCW